MRMRILSYLYGIADYCFCYDHGRVHWRNLVISLPILFRAVTPQDWTDVMYMAMELSPCVRLYFVSVAVAGAFVVNALFITADLNGPGIVKRECLQELQVPPSRGALVAELGCTRTTLGRLRMQLARVTSRIENDR